MTETFQVQGMTCGHCKSAVTAAVKTVDPQAQVAVDLATGRVEVQTSQPREPIVQAIREEGYTVAA